MLWLFALIWMCDRRGALDFVHTHTPADSPVVSSGRVAFARLGATRRSVFEFEWDGDGGKQPTEARRVL